MDSRSALQLMISLTTISLLFLGYGFQGTVSMATPPVSKPFLSFVEFQRNSLGRVKGLNGVWSVTVSPDGKHVYTAGYRDDSVAVFSRNAATGKLTFVEVQKDGVGGVDGLSGVISVIVSPDGKHVYAGAYWDEAVSVFSRDANTGKLIFLGLQKEGAHGVDGLNGIRSVTVSQDGKHIYAAGYRGQAVALFGRDGTTGRLTFLGAAKEGKEGVAGLQGVTSVIVTKDGKHVYATGFIDSTVAVFSRDATTGKLTFVEKQQDGVVGVEGLKGAFSVTVSPDSRYAYVAAFAHSALVVFSRDGMTGKLTFVEMRQDGVGGVKGLKGTSSLVMGANGKYLYAAGYIDNAVTVFSRDATTGKLSFIEVQREGVGGVNGLGGVRCVTVSPDGRHVYIAGTLSRTVAVFSTLSP